MKPAVAHEGRGNEVSSTTNSKSSLTAAYGGATWSPRPSDRDDFVAAWGDWGSSSECGTLRAVHDLATGHPVEALQRNPLAVLLIPVAVLALLAWVRRAALGRRRRWDLPVWLPWAFLALTVAFGVLRNLPEIGWLGP